MVAPDPFSWWPTLILLAFTAAAYAGHMLAMPPA